MNQYNSCYEIYVLTVIDAHVIPLSLTIRCQVSDVDVIDVEHFFNEKLKFV